MHPLSWGGGGGGGGSTNRKDPKTLGYETLIFELKTGPEKIFLII